jgi:hypothetical protein
MLKVMTRVQVEGWVEVEREVADDFDPSNIDVSSTPEDVLVAQMAATATHRLSALMRGARSKALEVRAEVEP